MGAHNGVCSDVSLACKLVNLLCVVRMDPVRRRGAGLEVNGRVLVLVVKDLKEEVVQLCRTRREKERTVEYASAPRRLWHRARAQSKGTEQGRRARAQSMGAQSMGAEYGRRPSPYRRATGTNVGRGSKVIVKGGAMGITANSSATSRGHGQTNATSLNKVIVARL